MHSLALVNPSRVTVGTPHRVWRSLPAFVHVVQRELPAQALTVHEGIASTTVAQAIVDCVDSVMGSRLREAINEGGRRHLLTSREQKALRARLDRRNVVGHRG
jgi:predicted transcriptional regulator of viral defense system